MSHKDIIPHDENGKAHGYWKLYDERSGKPQWEANYIHGKLEGLYKSYWTTGKPSTLGYYTNDRPSGYWKNYHSLTNEITRKTYYLR